MSNFCDHCEGQRFDRAQVLRTLRRVRNELRESRCSKRVDEAITMALKAVARLELPHLDVMEDSADEVVH